MTKKPHEKLDKNVSLEPVSKDIYEIDTEDGEKEITQGVDRKHNSDAINKITSNMTSTITDSSSECEDEGQDNNLGTDLIDHNIKQVIARRGKLNAQTDEII